MDCTATRISYRDTGAFSTIMTDYLAQNSQLKEFYRFSPSWNGIEEALELRPQFPVNRPALVEHLREQYQQLQTEDVVYNNIDRLLLEQTFTITTAHQPNLFTGPLYFIFKIMHAIRLAEEATQRFPGKNFVPVYYMGNEDADLDELGHFYLRGERINWTTKQTGAVGYMKVDQELLRLIDRVAGELGVMPFGSEIVEKLRTYYRKDVRIQDATLALVNDLFGRFGLVVMIASSPRLKEQMIPVFEQELLGKGAAGFVENTAARLADAGYKVQAHPREINLFYLAEGIRNRIERTEEGGFAVNQTNLHFTQEEMLNELHQFPERFSPNVILRGLYQETILPNIAFVGGGGETAYWLQLKDLFASHQVSFPVLLVRNSFLLISDRQAQQLEKMRLPITALFQGEEKIMEQLVRMRSGDATQLNSQEQVISQLYDELRTRAGAIDQTLIAHVEALKKRSLQRVEQLGKKMMRAEKRKLSDERRQLTQLRNALFPTGGLQERVESFMSFYAQDGKAWLDRIYQYSLGVEQEFVLLQCP